MDVRVGGKRSGSRKRELQCYGFASNVVLLCLEYHRLAELPLSDVRIARYTCLAELFIERSAMQLLFL